MATVRFSSEKVDPAPLGQPLTFEFSGKTAKNRFLKSSMSERLSSWSKEDVTKRGIPRKELINVYRKWGEGGFGIVLVGNVMIEYDQLEAAGNPIIPFDAPFSGERFEAFKDLATGAKKQGSLIYAQISHPGRQVASDIQPHPISPSDVRLEKDLLGASFSKPRPMEKEDFDRLITNFAHSAEYLYKAGYDGIELHAAHGYLLAQFLSLTTNKRTDQYGGSLVNRARIIVEIADAIRARVPDKSFSIGIKANSVEFQEGGFQPEDAVSLCVELEKHGFDWVELSGGTYESLAFGPRRESSKKREAFFLEFAEKIIPQLTKTKVYVTGGLRSASGLVNALETVDGVGFGRPAAHEFDLPQKLIDGKVTGAIKVLVDDNDFGTGAALASAQMLLVGQGKQPLDLSREDHKAVFLASFGKWVERRQQDPNLIEPPSIVGIELQPYGTVYA